MGALSLGRSAEGGPVKQRLNTNPDIVTELKRLAEKAHGLLKPEDVIRAAEPEGSVLHDRFEWDDSEAAHQYRLEQARKLIRVTVELLDGKERALTRVFVSLSSDREKEGGGYRSTVDVMNDAQMRQQLLEDALDEMEYFKHKYAALQELKKIFSAISSTRRQVVKQQRKAIAA